MVYASCFLSPHLCSSRSVISVSKQDARYCQTTPIPKLVESSDLDEQSRIQRTPGPSPSRSRWNFPAVCALVFGRHTAAHMTSFGAQLYFRLYGCVIGSTQASSSMCRRQIAAIQILMPAATRSRSTFRQSSTAKTARQTATGNNPSS